ncbi:MULTISPECIES: hypothetical protein [unclassified Burkholderia]|uniref:hypothetical protein n=1 Tax=unclassified Burkholderia TaxID=2613784 RepID=UPI000F583A79|nr:MULTISPECIES: hypothetical protein [unclassified Burkholderia]
MINPVSGRQYWHIDCIVLVAKTTSIHAFGLRNNPTIEIVVAWHALPSQSPTGFTSVACWNCGYLNALQYCGETLFFFAEPQRRMGSTRKWTALKCLASTANHTFSLCES